MLVSIPQSALPILVGIVAMSMVEILRILSAWKQQATQLHQLKYETHTLRLRIKKQSAERIVAEEQHRATFSNQLNAA